MSKTLLRLFCSKKDYLRRLPEKLRTEWLDFSPMGGGDTFDVPCRICPKYRSFPPRCTVPIGGRLRSCVCASIEYHFRDMRAKRVLEVGCGENPFAKTVVESAGGEWIGVDPRSGKQGRSSVRKVAGEAQHLPFADAVFDVAMGVQTIEHWDRSNGADPNAEYQEALSEIWRTLRPGGSIYFDAPIHLHGSPEFIRGDFDGIRGTFSSHPWVDLKFMTWRKNHGLLRKIIAIKKERERWPEILQHDERALSELKGKSVYIVAIVAQKPGSDQPTTLSAPPGQTDDPLLRILPILACPASGKPLRLVGDRLVSTDESTRRAYRVENGVPLLLLQESVVLGEEEWSRLMGK